MERRQLCSEALSGAHDLFKGGKERVASMSWFPRATEPQPPAGRETVRPVTLAQVSQPEAEALEESGSTQQVGV